MLYKTKNVRVMIVSVWWASFWHYNWSQNRELVQRFNLKGFGTKCEPHGDWEGSLRFNSNLRFTSTS